LSLSSSVLFGLFLLFTRHLFALMADSSVASVRAALQRYDTNGDGTIDAKALISVLRGVGGGHVWSDARISTLLRDFTVNDNSDANSDSDGGRRAYRGRIRYDDFVNWLYVTAKDAEARLSKPVNPDSEFETFFSVAAQMRAASGKSVPSVGAQNRRWPTGVALPGPPESPCVDLVFARSSRRIVEVAASNLGWRFTKKSTSSSSKSKAPIGENDDPDILTPERVKADPAALVIWVFGKQDFAAGLARLQDGQWISRVPGTGAACQKADLADGLQRCAADFMPWSWTVPAVDVEHICQSTFARGRRVLIVKPTAGFGGKGISLVRSVEELHEQINQICATKGKAIKKAGVVQAYVERPLLLGGYKWDVRLYALIIACPGLGPDGGLGLRTFLARDGLVRVCVEPYCLTHDASQELNMMAHLTNYSLSKHSELYDHSCVPGDAFRGCKRTFSSVLKRLETEDPRFSAASTWNSLGGLTKLTMDTVGELLQKVAFRARHWDEGEGFAGNGEVSAETLAETARQRFGQCFQIVGLDVLLDSSGQPWILEANCRPSLNCDEVRLLPPLAQPTADHCTLSDGASPASDTPKAVRGSIKSPITAAAAAAASKTEALRGGDDGWGKPCICKALPSRQRHCHRQCPVDVAVKLPVTEGALTIVSRAAAGKSQDASEWAVGTIFEAV